MDIEFVNFKNISLNIFHISNLLITSKIEIVAGIDKKSFRFLSSYA
jgi:hypothetical protein